MSRRLAPGLLLGVLCRRLNNNHLERRVWSIDFDSLKPFIILTGALLTRIQHDGPVLDVLFLANATVSCGHYDGVVSVWDARRGKKIHILEDHMRGFFGTIAQSRDGTIWGHIDRQRKKLHFHKPRQQQPFISFARDGYIETVSILSNNVFAYAIRSGDYFVMHMGGTRLRLGQIDQCWIACAQLIEDGPCISFRFIGLR